jgi:hypothetical protein
MPQLTAKVMMQRTSFYEKLMSGAIPPLPQYAFMAWCLVKAQGQLYLLDRVFSQFHKYHMKILLRDNNSKVGREGIFRPTIGIVVAAVAVLFSFGKNLLLEYGFCLRYICQI